MEIQLTEGKTKGSSIAKENGETAGRMIYSIASKDLIIIEHTDVEPMFSGKGVGKKLLYKIVEMAREKNIKIIPTCSYANAMFQKLTDIQDVLK